MSPRSANQQREGLFWMAVAVASYSSFSIFTKLLYAHSEMQPLDVASWRFLLATPLVWIYLWLRGRTRGALPLPPQRHLLLLGAIYCMASVLAFFGLQLISASIYVILFFTYPILVALLGQFLGTSLRREGWLALLVTSLGVLLVIAPSVDSLRVENVVLVGMMIALANAWVAAVYFIASNRILFRLQDPSELARAVAWTMLATSGIMLLIAFVHGLQFPRNLEQALLLLGLAGLSTALPIVALNIGIQRLGAARSAIVMSMEPFLTLVLAAILLSERLSGLQLLGGMVILLSVTFFEMSSLRRGRRPRWLPEMTGTGAMGPADVRRALDAAGCADIEIRFFDESTATAPQAAAAVGCELGQIIKSLAFLVAGAPCLVLMGGDGRVEERALAAQYGVGRKRVRAAKAAQCLEIFGYAPGGVPPVGLRTEVPVWLDAGLRRYEVLYAAGGAPNAIFGIARGRLERLCGQGRAASQDRYLEMRR